jgi:surface antigen
MGFETEELTFSDVKFYDKGYQLRIFHVMTALMHDKKILPLYPHTTVSSIKQTFGTVLACLLALISAGCTAESTGQLLGGSMGALVGSQIGGGKGNVIATVIGGVAGVALGGMLGKTFDEKAKKNAELAAQQAANTGQGTSWSASGASGTWSPGPIQYGPQHQCYRQLTCLATDPDGKPVTLKVNAVKGADGHWHIPQ